MGIIRRLMTLLHLEARNKAEPLTDEMMKDMMPLFVEDQDPPSHNCGSCFMRVHRGDDTGECTVQSGPISMKRGTCVYWAKGKASIDRDIHESRMTPETAGYVENDGPINCGSCRHNDDGYCTLWMGLVERGQCCTAWEPEDAEEERP